MLNHITPCPRLSYFSFRSFLSCNKLIRHFSLPQQMRLLQHYKAKYSFSSSSDPERSSSFKTDKAINDPPKSQNSKETDDVSQKRNNIAEAMQQMMLLSLQSSTLTFEKKFDDATNSLKQAQEIMKTLDSVQDKDSILSMSCLIAGRYRELGKLDDAVKCIEDALKLQNDEEKINFNLLGIALLTLGRTLHEKKALERSKSYFLFAKECFEKNENCNQWFDFNFYFGKLLLDKQEAKESLEYLRKAVSMIEKGNKVRNIIKAEAYFYLSRAYEETKDISNAKNGYLKLCELKDAGISDEYEKAKIKELLQKVAERLNIIDNN